MNHFMKQKTFKKFWALGVVDEILWINLLFFKDNINAGVAFWVHTAVVEGFTVPFWWGPDIVASSLGRVPDQDQGNKHDLSLSAAQSGILIWVGGIFGKVAPWNKRKGE